MKDVVNLRPVPYAARDQGPVTWRGSSRMDSAVRRAGWRLDHEVSSSLGRVPNLDDFGGYRVRDARTGAVLAGANYELSRASLARLYNLVD